MAGTYAAATACKGRLQQSGGTLMFTGFNLPHSLNSMRQSCDRMFSLLRLLQEWPPHSKVRPIFQTNPIRQYVPTWEKFNHIGAHIDHKWDCGVDWLDDYTYYAEVVGDDSNDWWGKGMTEPSDGDADVPQPKVYRSFTKSSMTMLDFDRCVFAELLHESEPCINLY